MDLQLELIKAIHRYNKKGDRELADNEFRCSQAVKGARVLYYDKLYPQYEYDAENPREGIEYIIDVDGIWHVPHVVGTAVLGTIIHEWIQSELGYLLLDTERKVTEITEDIIRTGHVDIDYDADEYNETMSDIKTTNINVIKWGIRGSNPNNYTPRKKLKNELQGNEYAIMSGYSNFNILQVTRDDLASFLTWFTANKEIDEKIKKKCVYVTEAVDKREPPMHCHNALCDLKGTIPHYCRHHVDYDGPWFDPSAWTDKSPANCPGRLRLQEIREIEENNRKLDDDYGN